MFDLVFIFFLFLVGVTCLLYYIPPNVKKGAGLRRLSSNDYYDIHSMRRSRNFQHSSASCSSGRGNSGTTTNMSQDVTKIENENIVNSNVATTDAIGDCIVRINQNCVCAHDYSITPSYLQESFKVCDQHQLVEVDVERSNSQLCYVKAKDFEIKDCNGPVFDV